MSAPAEQPKAENFADVTLTKVCLDCVAFLLISNLDYDSDFDFCFTLTVQDCW